MEINQSTRLADLLAAYPFLKEKLAKIHPRFQMLQTPLAKVMLPKATLGDMIKRSGLGEEELIQAIRELVK
ncbi:MAG: DUF1858 domain-containing protein [Clostridia bacterium]|nr:DUF1858 domain-containing protein [Clostridia bacterium]